MHTTILYHHVPFETLPLWIYVFIQHPTSWWHVIQSYHCMPRTVYYSLSSSLQSMLNLSIKHQPCRYWLSVLSAPQKDAQDTMHATHPHPSPPEYDFYQIRPRNLILYHVDFACDIDIKYNVRSKPPEDIRMLWLTCIRFLPCVKFMTNGWSRYGPWTCTVCIKVSSILGTL